MQIFYCFTWRRLRRIQFVNTFSYAEVLSLPHHVCTFARVPHMLVHTRPQNNLRQRLLSFTNFNAQLLYSLTIYMLHYNPRHVPCINLPIFRRTNCIITASGIVDESRLLCILLSSGILYSRLQKVTIPDAVIIKFVLLKMGMLMLETCRGL